MTNPNNAVGTNGAFGGRTSVNAFNDVMGAFQGQGILSGWGIVPSSGMTVNVGGSGTVRDTAVAEDNAGNKTSINNISGSAISVTLDTAPASNSRYDAIVAYVDKPPMGSGTQDNPECCGIIPVTGTAASTPSYPDDNTIRSAITADGASGSTAYYVVLGYVLVASGTTTITSGMITAGPNATISTNQIADSAITTSKIANGAVTSQKVDWATLTGYTSPASLTGVTLSGSYQVTDLTGWTTTIPNSIQNAKYLVEAVTPYVSVGTNYKMLILSYSNNTQFANFVENTSSDVGLRVSGIATGTGSNLAIKVQIQLNGPGTTSGRIDGGYIRWQRIS